MRHFALTVSVIEFKAKYYETSKLKRFSLLGSVFVYGIGKVILVKYSDSLYPQLLQ